MTSFLAICFVIALLLTLRALHDFGMHQHRCWMCGGKGRHEPDCKLKED